MTAFEEMGILPELGKAVEELDWTLPTDVQAEAIPLILGGGDVLMAAETGSGKTGAFCLPVIQIVHETIKDVKEGKKAKLGQASAATSTASSTVWKLNVFDRGDAIAIDANGLLCQSRDQQKWHGTRSNKSVYGKGKYYYEATVTDEGLCRVGWSTEQASLDLGTDAQGFGFGGTGKKSFCKQFDDYGEPYGLNDTIGCALDLDNETVSWSKNGVNLGDAFKIPKSLKSASFCAAVVMKNAEILFNFGDQRLKYLPQGYVALSSAPANCVSTSRASGVSAGSSKKENHAPYAIIMEPSRELAEQTLAQIHKFKKYLDVPVRDLVCLGGVNAKDQIASLNQGVDIVVGTPGRLEDLISTGNMLLSQVRFLILDEADGLLSGGYGDLINRMHGLIPKVTCDGKHLQMVVCSATLHSPEVKRMADRLMRFPTWIDLKGEDAVPETVHHVVCMIDPHKDMSWTRVQKHIATDGVHERDRLDYTNPTKETLSEAVKILKGDYLIKAIDEHKMDKAIVFCRTKIDCDNVEAYLTSRGGGPSAARNHPYSCVCLHSDRKPEERKSNLERFKKNEVRFLVCTDVAARGIDITGLPYVINMTLPDEKQNYVHRIGRVGRAERMGLAISFVSTVPEKVWYHSNCSSKGKGCFNTRLTDQGGCCIWYNEVQLLADVEDHLVVTIDQVDDQLKVPVNEYDGKVVYGQKRKSAGTAFKGHTEALAPAVQELAELERRAQTTYIDFRYRATAK